MKPVLEAPGSIDLKPTYDGPHPNCAFSFNLRRFILGRPGKRVTQDDIARAFVALKEKYPEPEWDGMDYSVIGPLYQLGRSYFCDSVELAFHPPTDMVGRCRLTLSAPC